MILETEITFDDEQAEKQGTKPEIQWRPGVINLNHVQAYCVCHYEGEALPEVTNLYTEAGNCYTVNVSYDVMCIIMSKPMSKPKTWEELIK